jgi:hypothetical protein
MIAIGAAALLASASIAAAEDWTGTIQSIDASAGILTLDTGQAFKLSPPLKKTAANWKEGDRVKITYTRNGADMNATEVSPAS